VRRRVGQVRLDDRAKLLRHRRKSWLSNAEMKHEGFSEHAAETGGQARRPTLSWTPVKQTTAPLKGRETVFMASTPTSSCSSASSSEWEAAGTLWVNGSRQLDLDPFQFRQESRTSCVLPLARARRLRVRARAVLGRRRSETDARDLGRLVATRHDC
jgi:hypothetical protein